MTDLFPPDLARPAASPQAPVADVSCRYCGSRPALELDFEQHTGMLLLRQTTTFPGPFCRDCGLNVFRSTTEHTLAVGWLGLVSFFVFPFVVLRNVLKRRLVRRLPAPVSPAGSAVGPAKPGRPLFARPLAYLVFIPILLLGAVALTSWLESPGRQVGKCVIVYGSAADLVPCSDKHDGVITAVADEPVECPGGTMTAVWLRSLETTEVFCVVEDDILTSGPVLHCGAMTIRRKVAFAACVAVAVLGSAFLVTVIAQGLQPGSETWYGTDARIRKARSTTEVAHVFAPGSRFTFGTSIRNPGPWPVTIVDIAANEVFSAVDVKVIDRSEPVTGTFGPAAARPFAAVTLPAGGEIAVFLTVVDPDVEMSPGSTTYFSDITVTYEVLGFGRLRRVPIGFDVGAYVPDAQVHG